MCIEHQPSTRDKTVEAYTKEPDAVVEILLNEIQRMKKIIQKQKERITTFEDRLKQDSHKSNKPPSTGVLKRTIISIPALLIRTECVGNCGKIFRAVDAALPPKIREKECCECRSDNSRKM
ncbi:MAG: hypothetical protein WAV76_07160 [Bacteroidota bacterium]